MQEQVVGCVLLDEALNLNKETFTFFDIVEKILRFL